MYGTENIRIEIFQDESTGVDAVHALEVAAADLGPIFDVVEPITITRFGIMPTVTFAYDTQTAEGEVALDRRIAYGSDTGRVELARVKSADTTPAGTTIKKDFNPIDCDVGDQLVLEAAVAATGGDSIAGDFKAYFCWKPRPETTGNQPEQTDTL